MDHVLNVQMETIPEETTVLIVSAGGNDGLHFLHDNMNRFLNPCSWLFMLHEFYTQFTTGYEKMVETLVEDWGKGKGRKIVLCTIYSPQFTWKIFNVGAQIALSFMNGCIKSTAAKYKLGVIDVYEIFDRAEDYANPIEPGVLGGDKLTHNILRAVEDISDELDGGEEYALHYKFKEYHPEETEEEIENEALRMSEQFTYCPWDHGLRRGERFRKL
jgi:hypothetical protein